MSVSNRLVLSPPALTLEGRFGLNLELQPGSRIVASAAAFELDFDGGGGGDDFERTTSSRRGFGGQSKLALQ